MQTQHTFRLKRTRTKEPLGLVLLSGEKTADGRPYNFFVKKVNPDTLASKAGVQSGDMIVQVDFHDLSRMNPQEAVARIKDKTLVTLTVIRNSDATQMDYHFSSIPEEHIYDEILYADTLSQNLSQLDENFPPFLPSTKEHGPRKHSRNNHRTDTQSSSSRLALKISTSPATSFLRATPGTQGSPHSGEKGSKDSGLSSGSSGSPHPKHKEIIEEEEQLDPSMDRTHAGRHSYRTEREMAKNFLKMQKCESTVLVPSSRNCRIEGEYEVEEIYLQKNGTSQLGVTLGYNTKSTIGHLYVCEVLPTGLAAQDGRLHCGDTIKRVNGFEVYDPEEAILLFLEQDQDITLTVARKMKPASSLPNEAQPIIHHDYAILEAKAGYSKDLRRIDSCGSLDSHTHKQQTGDGPDHSVPHHMLTVQRPRDVDEAGYEYMSTSRASSSPTKNPRKSSSPPMSNLSPNMRSISPLGSKNRTPLAPSRSPPPPNGVSPNHSFKPIPATKPRARASTGDMKLSANGNRPFHRPSSTTPDSQPSLMLQNSQVEHEVKIMAPSLSLRKVSPSFQSLSTEFNKLPNRGETGHGNAFVYNHTTESLV